MYGYLYLMFTSITEVFQQYYHFSTQAAGLVFLGLGIGSMGGLVFFSITSDKHLKKMSAKEGQGMKPEYRLQPLPVGAFLLPVGFFIYGWTAQARVHWIAPIIGTAIIGVGNLITFMALQLSVTVVMISPSATSGHFSNRPFTGTSSMPSLPTLPAHLLRIQLFGLSLALCFPLLGCQCTLNSV